MEQFSIPVGADSVTACRYAASGDALLLLAHGAGADQNHPFMVRYASGLAARGINVVTFNFFYTDAKRKAPDRAPALLSCFRGVIDAVTAVQRPRVFAIGGKSMGGRMASMLQAETPRADKLVFLGYPLHPPKEPEKLRAAHLPQISAPMLFMQGARDPFGTPAELQPILAAIPNARLYAVEGGDHSLAVPKKLRAQALVDGDALDEIAHFLA